MKRLQNQSMILQNRTDSIDRHRNKIQTIRHFFANRSSCEYRNGFWRGYTGTMHLNIKTFYDLSRVLPRFCRWEDLESFPNWNFHLVWNLLKWNWNMDSRTVQWIVLRNFRLRLLFNSINISDIGIYWHSK